MIDISIIDSIFDQNYLQNYRNETNANIKGGHFYLNKYSQLNLYNCTFKAYNKTILDII